MSEENKVKEKSESKPIRKIFITGILVMLPLVVTFYILKILYSLIVSNLMPLSTRIAKAYHVVIPESLMGIVTVILLLLIIFLVGLLTRMYIGRMLLSLLDKTVSGIPIVKSIYNAIKQMIDSFQSTSSNFDRCVLVEFPKSEVYCVGFVVRTTQPVLMSTVGEPCLNVYLPTAPNPTSGFITVIPEKNCTDLPIGVDEGIKFIFSVGIINFGSKKEAEKTILNSPDE